MPVLNYTTKIDSEKTVFSIQKMLAKSKAKTFYTEYDDEGILDKLSFQLNTPAGKVAFKLPANISGVYQMLLHDSKVPKKLRTREQASRVAWRIVKDWVEAQLAMIEVSMVDMVEVFSPYAITNSGETVYEKIKNTDLAMLTYNPE